MQYEFDNEGNDEDGYSGDNSDDHVDDDDDVGVSECWVDVIAIMMMGQFMMLIMMVKKVKLMIMTERTYK